jgi:hypothetical protein
VSASPCRCFITPRSYLDLLQQYRCLLNASRTELGDKRRRLLNGIAKLSETNATLDAMHAQLNELQPMLAEKTAATGTLRQQVRLRSLVVSGLLVAGRHGACRTGRFDTPLRALANPNPTPLQVREEQAEAQSVATVIAAEEAEVAAKAATCKAFKDDAAAELVRAQARAHTS